MPWPWLRWTLAILGAYGLLWAIGLTCSVYTRPHTIGPAGRHLVDTVRFYADDPQGALNLMSTQPL